MKLMITNELGKIQFKDSPTESHEYEVFQRMKADSSISEFMFLDCPGVDGKRVHYRRCSELQMNAILERESERNRKRTERIHRLHEIQYRQKNAELKSLIDRMIDTTDKEKISELTELIRKKANEIHEFGEKPDFREN